MNNPDEHDKTSKSKTFLVTEPKGNSLFATDVLLAHGAGAPMDSPTMDAWASAMSSAGFRVIRFEFEYMRQRRFGAKRRPPPRQPKLLMEFAAVVEQASAQCGGRLILGGKSMGGRVASRYAAGNREKCAGVVVLGYPFHAPGKLPTPERMEHLADPGVPTLILQGERDPFGNRSDVSKYREAGSLGRLVDVAWLTDGDHSGKPRKRSGTTLEDNLRVAAERAEAWMHEILALSNET